MFDMALTKPSNFTMQLTNGVDFFAHVLTKSGHFEQLLWQHSAIWQQTVHFLSNVTGFLDFFGNYYKF